MSLQKAKIKIVADKNIPFLRGIFEDVADIEYLAAPDIDKFAIKVIRKTIVTNSL